jgi:8-amino-7-oxononanoate synthase
VEFLKQGLQNLGFLAIAFDSPIVAIEMGDIAKTLQMATHLRENGIFAPAIRPPTVPTPRIRLTLMASHTQAQIQFLMQCLQSW